MATQRIFIKSAHVGTNDGPFTITDDLGNVVASNVSRAELLSGNWYSVDTGAKTLTIASGGPCNTSSDVVIYPGTTPTTTTTTSTTSTTTTSTTSTTTAAPTTTTTTSTTTTSTTTTARPLVLTTIGRFSSTSSTLACSSWPSSTTTKYIYSGVPVVSDKVYNDAAGTTVYIPASTGWHAWDSGGGVIKWFQIDTTGTIIAIGNC